MAGLGPGGPDVAFGSSNIRGGLGGSGNRKHNGYGRDRGDGMPGAVRPGLGASHPLITFSVMYDTDEHFSKYVMMRTRRGDTVALICARLGQPEMARTVANLNGIRHSHKPIKPHTRLRLPGIMRQSDVISVVADDPPPLVKDGYAQYDIVPVPSKRGITRFKGYNPWLLDLPIQWEEWRHPDRADRNEWEMWTLQRMAGRGSYYGAGQGPPPVIRISVTGPNGRVVPLLPHDFQWFPHSGAAPLWRINGIAWDPNPIRRGIGEVNAGRRLRQKAVVTIQQYTPMTIPEGNSASNRSRARNHHSHGTFHG